MSTIKEIAKLAGVSIGTVSHVISGAVPVSERLRLKVESAIETLDYHPNHIARSLKTSQSRTLGIIIPDMTVAFFPKVVKGAEVAAWENGYSLITVTTDDDIERETAALSLLRSKRVDGILLVTASNRSSGGHIQRVADSGIPVVCLDRLPPGISVDSVCTNNLAASEQCVNHLLALGHKRIAIATGSLTLKNEQQRLEGYKRALKRARIDPDIELIWTGSFSKADNVKLYTDRLRYAKTRPTALFCTNGLMGLSALRALSALGLSCPDDVAFVTFDELSVDDLFRPRITTLIQPAYEIGFRGTETLLQRIKQVEMKIVSMRLKPELRIGDSSTGWSDQVLGAARA